MANRRDKIFPCRAATSWPVTGEKRLETKSLPGFLGYGFKDIFEN